MRSSSAKGRFNEVKLRKDTWRRENSARIRQARLSLERVRRMRSHSAKGRLNKAKFRKDVEEAKFSKNTASEVKFGKGEANEVKFSNGYIE